MDRISLTTARMTAPKPARCRVFRIADLPRHLRSAWNWAAHQERLTADNAKSCNGEANACHVRDQAAPAQAAVQGRYWTHCVTRAATSGGMVRPRVWAVFVWAITGSCGSG